MAAISNPYDAFSRPVGAARPPQPLPTAESANPYDAFSRPVGAPQARPKPSQDEPGFIRRAIGGAVDLVTGGDRRGPYRELTELTPDEGGASVAAGLLLTPDIKAQTDIALANLPGSKLSQDENGEPLIEYKGEKFYVNKPGASIQDITNTAAQVLQFLPAAKAVSGVGNVALRSALMGAGAAGTSALQDVGAGQLGSEQGVDPVRAAATGVFGAGFEAMSPVAKAIWARLPWKPAFSQGGALTPEGAAALRRAKIDPRRATREVLAELDRVAKAGGKAAMRDPDQVAGVANQAAAGEFRIPLTRGQATGNSEILRQEERLRRSAGTGDRAYQIMRTFDRGQSGAIDDAAAAIQAGKGGPAGASQQDVGGAVVQGVKSASAASKKAVREAYDAIDMRSVEINPAGLGDLFKGIRDNLRSDRLPIDAKLTPQTVQALRDMGNYRKTIAAAQKSGRVQPVALDRLETMRRRLGAYIETAATDTDKAALGAIKRSLDEWADAAMDSGLMSGDPAVLNALKNARALRTEHARKFAPQNADLEAGRVVEKLVKADVTNQEAVNWLYGASELGSSPGVARVLARMERIFGRDSQQWNLIRQGAVNRIIYGPQGSSAATPQRGHIIKRIRNAIEGRGAEISGRLFSAEERAELLRFASAIERTIPDPKLGNPSGTGFEVADAVAKLAQRILGASVATQVGPAGFIAADQVGGMLASRAATKQAQQAVSGVLPKFQPVPLFTAAGAATGGELSAR